jgi:dihydroflavonol-4-reductase
MKIFVTGATGLIGSHSAHALLAAGHEVVLYVRNAQMARDHFAALGYDLKNIVVGDIRDKARVLRAMTGCDAVLHAAAIVSLDPRKEREIIENNLHGTRAVVGTACEIGIPNIVYVSSLEVFDQKGRTSVDESSPLGNSRIGYSKSKRQCEDYVRDLQRQRKPIQITYPAGVFGPDDPKLSEANRALTTLLAMVPRTTTGMQCVDARDIGLAHRWLIEHGVTQDFQNARYILGGRYYPWAELHRSLEEATGKKVTSYRIPGGFLRFIGATTDVIKAIVPLNTQVSRDAMAIATQWTPADSSRFTQKSGIEFRPIHETLTATIAWMAQAGHISKKLAGQLANR